MFQEDNRCCLFIMAAKPFRTDAFGHPLANWDDHTDCRTCMHSRDIFCARGTPCSTCSEWTEEKWHKWDAAINSAARKKAKRASIAQQKALQLAALEAGRGLAPATPANPTEAAPGPKPRPVTTPAVQRPPVTSPPARQLPRVAPPARHPPVPLPALGDQSRSESAPAAHYRIPRRLPLAPAPVPAPADTRVVLSGRGPHPYSHRYRSPSPKARDSYRRDEDVGRMPPPKSTPYDDRGHSRRERETR